MYKKNELFNLSRLQREINRGVYRSKVAGNHLRDNGPRFKLSRILSYSQDVKMSPQKGPFLGIFVRIFGKAPKRQPGMLEGWGLVRLLAHSCLTHAIIFEVSGHSTCLVGARKLSIFGLFFFKISIFFCFCLRNKGKTAKKLLIRPIMRARHEIRMHSFSTFLKSYPCC